MSIIVKQYTFSAGAVIVAAEHNSNFDVIYNDYNGNITNANISASAAIALSKISFTTPLIMSSAIIKPSKGADVASVAGAITLGDDGNQFDITGTNAITSITAKTAGTIVVLQFDSTASLVDGSNLKIAGNFQGAAESTITLYCDGTNWFEISRSPAFTATVSNALSGSLIQKVSTETGAVATGTGTVPDDDSPPQNGEGDEYMTRAITPSNSSNTLKITVVFIFAHSVGGGPQATSIFQDSTSSALATCAINLNSTAESGVLKSVSFIHHMTAGTTSSTTFKVRSGNSQGGTTTFNGVGGSRKYGGVLASSITIEEYKA